MHAASRTVRLSVNVISAPGRAGIDLRGEPIVRLLAIFFAAVTTALFTTPLAAQEVSLSAPSSAFINATVEVTWRGPDAEGDYIAIAEPSGKAIPYSSYAYTAKSGGSVKLRLPEKAGDYSIAYLTKQKETLHFVPIAAEAASATLDAPDSVPAGSAFTANWTGPDNEKDYVAIGDAGGKRIPYSSYGYTAQYKEDLPLVAPEAPGAYSVVYVTGSTVLESRPLAVTGLDASVDAPQTVPANSRFSVAWTGPDNPGDRLIIGDANGKPIPYSSYGYTARHPGEMELTAPEKPGAYTVVYVSGSTPVTSVPFTVSALSATVAVPDAVPAGSLFTVEWTGPDNEGDRLRVHTADGKWIPYASYAYTALNPGSAELAAPEKPGPYTVAYVTGDSVVTTVALNVVEVTARLDAAEEVDAGVVFPVVWEGPGNPRDTIVLVGDDPNFPLARGYIANSEGDTVMLNAPTFTGDFELRYLTPGGRQLAARAIRVVAPPEKPGTLVVLPATGTVSLSALEVVLDASGSMLQRQDGKRRIDIARETLSALLRDTISDGTPFALRVFGHKEADSCRTDLEIPLGPLDKSAALGLIGGVEAVNLAKTPIGRSLELVESDLKGATGERVIVLVTDGEETCDGDPAAAISALRAKGADLRVNIVGYAIDDAALAGTFANWAELGGGAYFPAGNRNELAEALTAATQPKFAVADASGTVLARGLAGADPIVLPAGAYEVRFDGGKTIAATVRPERETAVSP